VWYVKVVRALVIGHWKVDIGFRTLEHLKLEHWNIERRQKL
jgi:hypothetical protein